MEEEYHKKAILEIESGNDQKGLEYIEKALEFAPYDPTYLTERGTIFLHLKEKDKCLKDMDTVVNLDPKNAFRYSCRAYSKAYFEDLDGAITDYEFALELDKEDAVAYNNLGLLLERKGYEDKAKKNFEKADTLSKEKSEYKDFFDSREKEEKENNTASFPPGRTEDGTLEESKSRPHKEINPFLEEDRSKGAIVKDVFRKKGGFREFMSFIFNGFKLKENDETRKS